MNKYHIITITRTFTLPEEQRTPDTHTHTHTAFATLLGMLHNHQNRRRVCCGSNDGRDRSLVTGKRIFRNWDPPSLSSKTQQLQFLISQLLVDSSEQRLRAQLLMNANKIFTTCNAPCKLLVSTASSEMITLMAVPCSTTQRPAYNIRLSCDYWI